MVEHNLAKVGVASSSLVSRSKSKSLVIDGAFLLSPIMLPALELDQIDYVCRVATFSGFNKNINSKASFRPGYGLRVVMEFDLIFESVYQYSTFRRQVVYASRGVNCHSGCGVADCLSDC